MGSYYIDAAASFAVFPPSNNQVKEFYNLISAVSPVDLLVLEVLQSLSIFPSICHQERNEWLFEHLNTVIAGSTSINVLKGRNDFSALSFSSALIAAGKGCMSSEDSSLPSVSTSTEVWYRLYLVTYLGIPCV